MLTWLTIQAFEFMFATEVTGMGLGFMQTLGFVEVMIEIGAVIVFIFALIHTSLTDKEEKKVSRKEIDKIKRDALEKFHNDHDDGDDAIHDVVRRMSDIVARLQ